MCEWQPYTLTRILRSAKVSLWRPSVFNVGALSPSLFVGPPRRYPFSFILDFSEPTSLIVSAMIDFLVSERKNLISLGEIAG